MATTLKAMERVQEIRQKREKAFWKNRYVMRLGSPEQSLDTARSHLLITHRMAGNKSRTLAESAQDISRHIELVQPRSVPVEQTAERERIKEKIKVRAKQRGEMARQMVRGKSASAAKGKGRESRLIPAEAGGMGMGMGMQVE